MNNAVARARLILHVSRPPTWHMGPTIWIAGLLHSRSDARSVVGVMFAVAWTLPFAFVTLGVNDVHDYASDSRNERKTNSWTDGRALAPKDHDFVLKAAKVFTCMILFLTYPASAASPELFIYITCILCLIWGYSMPPLRIKEKPVLDSLCNGAILWLFWACGYVFDGDKSLLSTQGVDTAAKNGRFVFLCGAALHALGSIPDISADALAGHQTIATVLGQRNTALFAAGCIFLARSYVRDSLLTSTATWLGALYCMTLTLAPAKLVRPAIRLMFLGAYLGLFVWAGKTFWRLSQGHDVSTHW